MSSSPSKPTTTLAAKVPGSHAVFSATRWSLVLQARQGNSAAADAALARLCEIYWYPIYAFYRQKGHSPHDAEDLTQGFFADILRREWLKNVGPEKGRFRTFVKKCLKNFACRPKRTLPEARIVRIDSADAEQIFLKELVNNLTPDVAHDKAWAMTLLKQASARLKAEYAAVGNAARYEALAPYLTKESSPDAFAAVAARLGLSEVAARKEASRMRQRYGAAIRAELAETVSGPEEIESERQELMAAVSA